MNNRLYTIQEVADILGVSTKTLRRWDQRGRFVPTRTAGNQRRYTQQQIQQFKVQSSKFKVNHSVSLRSAPEPASNAAGAFFKPETPKEFKPVQGLPSALSSLPSNSFLKHHFLLKHKDESHVTQVQDNLVESSSFSESPKKSFEPAGSHPAKLNAFKMGFVVAGLVLVLSFAGSVVMTRYNLVAGIAQKKEQFAKFIANLPQISISLKPRDLSFAPQNDQAVLAATTGDSDLILNVNVPSFFSQSVGIGTTTVDPSAILDIASEDKGFLAPRMTTVQRDAITTPATGLFVYNTDTNHYNMYNGTAWQGVFTSIGDSTLGEAFTKDGKEGNSLYFHGTGGGIGQVTGGAISGTQTYTLPGATGTFITTGNLADITKVGTIGTGVWNGTVLTVPYGGTGVSTLTGIVLGNGSGVMTGLTTSVGISGAISDETGTGALVFGTSPAITTSLTTTSTTFALINTAATTVNFAGAATTLSIGATTGTTTINNATTAITGALTANGDVTLGDAATDNITFTGRVALDSDLLPIGTTGTNDLGSSTLPWDNLYANNVIAGGTSGIFGWLQRNAQTLSPTNITDDFLLGGISTASAKFGILNIAGGNPTATMSSNLSLIVPTGNAPAATFNLLNNGTLNIQRSPGGDAGLATAMFVSNNGNIGIGTTAPGALLHVRKDVNDTVGDFTNGPQIMIDNPDAATDGGISAVRLMRASATKWAWVNDLQMNAGDDLTLWGQGGIRPITVKASSGNVGIGNTTPLTALDVAGSASLSADLSLRGAGTNHLFNILDNGTLNFQRSAGGDGGLATALFINNSGNVGIGNTSPGAMLSVGSSTPALISSAGLLTIANTTDSTSGSTGSINTLGGLGVTKDLAVDGGDIVTAATTFNLINTTATTVNFAGAATTLSVGATTGTTTINNDVTLGNATADNITFTGRVALDSDLLPIGTTGTNDLGSSALPWDNLYANNVIAGGTSGIFGWLQRNAQALSPTNITDDFLLGAISTASAKFGILNIAGGNPTATMSSNLSLIVPTGNAPAATFNLLNNGTLNFQRSAGGDAGLTSAIFIQGDGNVGIGTTAPAGKLDVRESGAKTDTSYGENIANTATATAIGAKNKYGLYVSSTGAWNTTGGYNYGLFVDATGGGTDAGAVENGDNGNVITGALKVGGVAADGPPNTNYALDIYGSTYVRSGSLEVNGSGDLSMNSGTGKFLQTFTGTTTDAAAIVANSLTSGNALDVSSSSTAALTGDALVNLSVSGANASSSITRYALYAVNTATGTTSTNVGGYFSASGATNNYGLIVDSGNVGIGNTTPLTALDVTGSASLSADLSLRGAGTAHLFNILQNGTLNIQRSPGGDAGLATALFIQNNGNVGIGNTAPGAMLSVGSSTPALISSAGLLTIANTTDSTSGSTGSVYTAGGLGVTKDLAVDGGDMVTAATTFNLINATATTLNLGGAATTFTMGATTGTASIRNATVNFPNATAIGIGNTAPLTALDVTGSASLSANLSLKGAGTAHTFNILDNGTLNFQRSPGGDAGLATALFIQNNGNVGIGTTAPTNKLTVDLGAGQNATGVLLTSSGTEASLQLKNTGTGGKEWQALSTGGSAGAGQGKFQLYNSTDAVTPFIVTSAGSGVVGNVGLGGQTSPLATLDVTGSASLSANLSLKGAGTAHTFNILDNGTLNIQRSPGGDAGLATALFIQNNGNVGIGNTAPGAMLSVGSSTPALISSAGLFTIANTTDSTTGSTGSINTLGGLGVTKDLAVDGGDMVTAATTFNLLNATATTVNFAGAATTFTLGGTTGTASIRNTTVNFPNATAIGIGNTAPLTALDVTGSASLSADLSLRGAGTNHLFNILQNGTLNIQRSPGGDAGLATALFINNSGNVGIGTTSPLEVLHVAGNATASGNLTLSGGARSIQTTALNTLTLGGSTTGNIVIDSGSSVITLSDAITAPTLDTGQGANELYDMDQNVLTTSSPTFANITDSGLTSGRVTFASANGLLVDDADLTFATDTLTATKFGATTLTGTIAGGGNQLNNIIIGTTTPLAGTFTTIQANTGITPDADDGAYLGQSGTGFSDLFLATGAVINFAAGDVTLTHAANVLGIEGGNVGIGTTAPLTALDVVGSASLSANLSLRGAGTAHTFNILDNGTLNFQRYPSGDAANNSSVLFLQNNGNVGIGTTAPGKLLDISALQDATFRISSTRNAQDWTPETDTFGKLEFYSADTSGANAGVRASIKAVNTSGYGWATALTFSTMDTASNVNDKERMRIDDYGNVGIGTTAPTSELYVTRPLSFGATGKALTVFDQIESQDIFTASASGSPKFVVTNAGNVGIGNMLPLTALDVTGSASLSANLSLRGAGTAHTFNILDNGTLNFQRSPGGDAGLAALPVLYLGNNGNVGIGTTGTESLVHLWKASAGTVTAHGSSLLTLEDSGESYINILTPNNQWAGLLVGDPEDNDVGRIIYGHSSNFWNIYVNGVDQMQWSDGAFAFQKSTTISSTGTLTINAFTLGGTIAGGGNQLNNIIIGTTTPLAGTFTTLQANTGITPDADDGAYLGQSGTGFSDLFLASGAVINFAAGDVTLTHAANVLGIEGGNVGIGTTAPLTALDVVGSASLSANLSLRGAGTAHTFNILDNGTLNFQRYPSGDAANNSSVLFLGNNGNVGIGTTAPSTLLHLYSTANANGNPTLTLENNGNDRYLPAIIFKNSDTGGGTAYPTSKIVGGFEGGSAWTNAMIGFETGSPMARVMTLTNGNVGIGTTSPLTALDVTGSASLSANLSLRGAGTAHTFNILDNGTLNFQRSPGGDAGLAANSALFIQNNGNVGIGNTTPLTALDVTGSASLSANLSLRGAGTAHTFNILDNGTFNIQRSPGGDAGLATALFIQSNGNVGIGTTSPKNILDVEGSAAIGTAYSGTNAAPANGLIVEGNVGIGTNDPGTRKLYVTATLTNPTATSVGSDNITHIKATSNNAQLVNAGMIQLDVPTDSTSNLGTLSALSLVAGPATGNSSTYTISSLIGLDIQNYVYSTGSVASITDTFGIRIGNPYPYNGTANAANVTNAYGLNVIGVSPTNSVNNYGIYIGAVSGATTSNYALYSNTTAASYFGGNVGIGNTTPLTALDVTGSASLSANLSLRGAGTAHTFNILDNGTLNIQRSPGGDAGLATALFIQNNGNVGIGTTTPSEKLEVSGNIAIGSNLLKTTNLAIQEADSNFFEIRNAADNAYRRVRALQLRADTFGANTANPAFYLGEADGEYGIFYAHDTGGLDIEVARGQGAADPYFSMGGSQEFKFYNSGVMNLKSNALVIDSSGNVGINNSTPLTALDVTGSASLSANLSLRGAGTAHTFNILDNGTLNIQRSPGGDAGLAANSVLYLGSNGSVGIGITAPTSKLDVYDPTANTQIRIRSAGTDSAPALQIANDVRTWQMTVAGGDADKFKLSDETAGLTRLTIDSSGLVGIRTTSPTLDLDIRSSAANSPAYLDVSNSDASKYLVLYSGHSGDNRGAIWWTSTETGLSLGPADSLTGSGFAEKLTILTGGNVGIGNTAPLTALDVTGSASLSANLSLKGAGTAHTFNILDNGTLNFQRSPGGDAGLASALLINSAGSVVFGNALLPAGDAAQDIGSGAKRVNMITARDLTLTNSITLDGGTVSLPNTTLFVPTIKGGSAVGSSLTLQSTSAVGTTDFINFKVGNNGATEAMRIIDSGNVGIGTTAPLFKLDVQDSQTATATAMIYNTSTGTDADGLAIKLGFTGAGTATNLFTSFLNGNGLVQGLIKSNASSGVTYQTNGVADFAEYFEKDQSQNIPFGSVVCFDGSGLAVACDNNSNKIVGVASEHPAFLGGDNLGDRSVPVGLVGQVKTRVSTANGEIKIGDPLTTSSTPGVAVKATQTGQILGKAIEGFNGSGEGSIRVSVNISWYNPSIYVSYDGTLAGMAETVTSIGDQLALQGLSLQDQIDQIASSSASINYVLATDPLFDSLNNKVANLQAKVDLLSSQAEQQASTSAFLMEIVNSQVLGASTSAVLDLGDVELNNAVISDSLNVLGRTTVTDLGVTGNINAGLLAIHGIDGEIGTLAGDLYLQKNGIGGVNILDGKVVIDTLGNMTVAGTVTADAVEANTYTVLGDQSIGSAAIPIGSTSIDILTSVASSSSKIFLTSTSLTDKQITVISKSDGRFKVAIPTASTSPITFDWWIVGNK